MSPRKIRIGAPYHLSMRPLMLGLTRMPKREVELRYDEWANLATLLEQEELDVALIPSIEFIRGVGADYIKGPASVARRKAGSMLLITKRPLDEVRRVAVDEFCRTPIAVLRIVLHTKYDILPDICVMKGVYTNWQETFDAVLLSGNKLLHLLHNDPDRAVGAYDVSSMWYELTSKPLVTSLWAFNDTALEGYLTKILLTSRNLGIKNLSLLADGVAATTPYDGQFLYQYYNEVWSYNLGKEEMAGLKSLEDYAVQYQLVRERRLTEEALAPQK